jgi:hypothetical protein
MLYRQKSEQLMIADRLQAGRSHAAALGAIRVPAKLTGRNPTFQVGCDVHRGAREDTGGRRWRRTTITPDYNVRQIQLREKRPQLSEVFEDTFAFVG